MVGAIWKFVFVCLFSLFCWFRSVCAMCCLCVCVRAVKSVQLYFRSWTGNWGFENIQMSKWTQQSKASSSWTRYTRHKRMANIWKALTLRAKWANVIAILFASVRTILMVRFLFITCYIQMKSKWDKEREWERQRSYILLKLIIKRLHTMTIAIKLMYTCARNWFGQAVTSNAPFGHYSMTSFEFICFNWKIKFQNCLETTILKTKKFLLIFPNQKIQRFS